MHQNNLNSALYPCRRIANLSKLSLALNIDDAKLCRIAKDANRFYRVAQRIPKSDGTERITYDVYPELKSIQQKIKRVIFDKVIFPNYLTGSIKGRDYIINAKVHCGARILFSADITDFFGSTTSDQIFKVWHRFFNFSHEVSELLTVLTTFHGVLPQGTTTSPHLSNLVLWKDEPALFEQLQNQGFIYTRYVDDISVSSYKNRDLVERTIVFNLVLSMMIRNGYRVNRKKLGVSTSGEPMVVNNLLINRENPTLNGRKCAKIRAAVHALEVGLRDGKFDLAQFNSVKGQVAHLKRLHPAKADGLNQRLDMIWQQRANKGI